jgi:hypothetical protein
MIGNAFYGDKRARLLPSRVRTYLTIEGRAAQRELRATGLRCRCAEEGEGPAEP